MTPTQDLFVLCHLGVPDVDAQAWTLEVGGLVDRPLGLSVADLRTMRKTVVGAVHQCAGNPLEPTVPTRRVANVAWGGVDVRTVLREAGVRPEARFLWSFGSDSGEFAGESCPSYAKDLPLSRVADGGVLLAYEVNGDPLPVEHGHPLRLVVPGFYGTNSVKWLRRIALADRRAQGLFTTRFYNDPSPNGGTRPVWDIPVEAVVVEPAPGASFDPGRPVSVKGWAWAASGVDGVEVSADDGRTWHPAKVEPRADWCWQRFAAAPSAPSHLASTAVLARAASRSGQVQPADGARNAIHRVELRRAST